MDAEVLKVDKKEDVVDNEDEPGESPPKVIRVEASTALTLTPASNGHLLASSSSASTESRTLPSLPLIRVKKDLVTEVKKPIVRVLQSSKNTNSGSNMSRHIRILKRRVAPVAVPKEVVGANTELKVADNTTTTTIALSPPSSSSQSPTLTAPSSTSATNSRTSIVTASKRALRLVPVSLPSSRSRTGMPETSTSTTAAEMTTNINVGNMGSNVVLKPRLESRLNSVQLDKSKPNMSKSKSSEASKVKLSEVESEERLLQQEVSALQWLARQKEEEWDAIIRLQKQKEERILKLRRRHSIIETESARAAATLLKVNQTLSRDRSRRYGTQVDGTNGISFNQDCTKKRSKNGHLPLCVKCDGKTAAFVCSGCNKAFYCSSICQARDWPRHATQCGE